MALGAAADATIVHAFTGDTLFIGAVLFLSSTPPPIATIVHAFTGGTLSSVQRCSISDTSFAFADAIRSHICSLALP
jgi:hypothetical protein